MPQETRNTSDRFRRPARRPSGRTEAASAEAGQEAGIEEGVMDSDPDVGSRCPMCGAECAAGIRECAACGEAIQIPSTDTSSVPVIQLLAVGSSILGGM